LELVRKKKELELEQIRLKLKTLELQQKILENQLRTVKTITETKLQILNELKKVYSEKAKELSVASLELYGVVGKVGITPNLALRSGEQIGKDFKFEITDFGIFLEDERTGEKLIVPTYSKSPEDLVKAVSKQIEKGKEFGQTFQLQSGEVYQLNSGKVNIFNK